MALQTCFSFSPFSQINFDPSISHRSLLSTWKPSFQPAYKKVNYGTRGIKLWKKSEMNRREMSITRSGDGKMLGLEALLFDCDGVLVDTERDGHRVSFNDTFAERGLDVIWDVELYGRLLKIGGGKERMTAYFGEKGWPNTVPETENERAQFIASLHKRKTELFMTLIEKGLLPLRPGVARIIDEALSKSVKVAVCSTSNEKAVSAIVQCLLGPSRANSIEIFAGDVVPRKKPDPAIYLLAASKLGVTASRNQKFRTRVQKTEQEGRCVVIEDSAIGLAAAKAAGMKCIITKSGYTEEENFSSADAVFECIGDPPNERFNLDFCENLLEK